MKYRCYTLWKLQVLYAICAIVLFQTVKTIKILIKNGKKNYQRFYTHPVYI